MTQEKKAFTAEEVKLYILEHSDQYTDCLTEEEAEFLAKRYLDWLRNGITRPQYNKEFMCLYCTSPNNIERTHCKKCGAPRSFVLG